MGRTGKKKVYSKKRARTPNMRICIHENVSMFRAELRAKERKMRRQRLRIFRSERNRICGWRNSYVAAAVAAAALNTRTIELEKRGGLLCSRIPSFAYRRVHT